MSDEQEQRDGQRVVRWRLSNEFASKLLHQAWFLLLVIEAEDPDNVPEQVRFEANALRAMTEEYAGGCSPLPPAPVQ